MSEATASWILDSFSCIWQSRCSSLYHQQLISKLSNYSQQNEWSSNYSYKSQQKYWQYSQRETMSIVVISSFLDKDTGWRRSAHRSWVRSLTKESLPLSWAVWCSCTLQQLSPMLAHSSRRGLSYTNAMSVPPMALPEGESFTQVCARGT